MNPILRLKTIIRINIGTIVFATLVPVFSNAQNLGVWNFNNTLTGTPGPGNSVSNAKFSAGITTVAFNGGSEYYGQNGWPAGGINTSSYMEFTLIPDAGRYLSILSVTLRMRRSNTGSPAGSGPTSWSIRSSVDGFASDISSGNISHNYSNYTVLTGGGFGYLTTAVTFRVYGFAASTSSGGNSRMVFDNISVSGIGALLPVHLISISSRLLNQHVQINYELGNTEPGTGYVLERSIDGNNFTGINTKNETQSLEHANYSYTDTQLPTGIEKIFYRLKMIDLLGRSTYSSIVYVQMQKQQAFKARLHGQSLTVSGSFEGNEQLSIYNAAGSCVFTRKQPPGQSIQFTLPAISGGVYYVVVQSSTTRHTIPIVAD